MVRPRAASAGRMSNLPPMSSCAQASGRRLRNPREDRPRLAQHHQSAPKRLVEATGLALRGRTRGVHRLPNRSPTSRKPFGCKRSIKRAGAPRRNSLSVASTASAQADLEVRSHVLSLREGELESRLKDRERTQAMLETQLQELTTLLRKERATREAQARRVSFLEEQLLAGKRETPNKSTHRKTAPKRNAPRRLKPTGRLRPSASKHHKRPSPKKTSRRTK